MKHTHSLLGIVGILVIVIALVSWQADRPSSTPQYDQGSRMQQAIRPVPMDDAYDFAGERVPIEIVEVRERLERELNSNAYRHGATMDFLRRSARDFAIIEPILKQEGVPGDFKYLAVAESGLRNAVSPAGAKGYWQFLKGTGLEHGLRINSQVDERYHFEKATRAACTYLKALKARFGSWTLAAAAYNMGPNGLAKELELQKESRYYDLNLSRETMRYVSRILAFKAIHSDPSRYGFIIDADEWHQPETQLRTIEVSKTQLSLADLAHEYGVTYRLLKYHNPWLLSHELHVKRGEVFYIKLPTK